MDYTTRLEAIIGSFTVKLKESEHRVMVYEADPKYKVELYCYDNLLESYGHYGDAALDRAQEDYFTIRDTIKHVLKNVTDSDLDK